MTNRFSLLTLGSWSEFIDPSLSRWYSLPPQLAHDLATGVIDHDRCLEPLSPLEFRRRRLRVEAWTLRSVKGRFLPYHGAHHFADVPQNARDAIREYDRLTGRTTPEAVVQALDCSLYAHDAYHTGEALRAHVPPNERPFPIFDDTVTQEWVTAYAYDLLAARQGFNLFWRLFSTQNILMTTFGTGTDEARGLGLPYPEPTSFWGCLPPAADAAFMGDVFYDLRQGLVATYVENSARRPEPAWDVWTERQRKHIETVRQRFDDLDRAAGVPLTKSLGWRGYLDEALLHIQAVADGDTVLRRRLQQFLDNFGVSLS